MNNFGTKEWIAENQKRVDYLNMLYEMDERDNPNHPHHDTYTGLFQNRQKASKRLAENVKQKKLGQKANDN